MPLDTNNRMEDPDRIYRMLIDAHRGLTDEESAVLNTRLVLILANQLADEAVIAEAIALAKADMGKADASDTGTGGNGAEG
ncbi:MAG: DUF2783 domain-containing protein [Salinarimonas sp.]|nr:DUF2783 domain-containing protein [Salinarimonas sp.]